MPTPSPSWALSPLPSGAGQFFLFQNRSNFFPEEEPFYFRTGAISFRTGATFVRTGANYVRTGRGVSCIVVCGNTVGGA